MSLEGQIKSTLRNLTHILEEDPRLAGCIRFNELEQTAVLAEAPRRAEAKVKATGKRANLINLTGPLWTAPPAGGRRWTDVHTTDVRTMLSAPRGEGGWGLKFGAADVDSAVDALARRRSFHPIRDYLDLVHSAWRGSPEHPGAGRVRRLFIDYFGCPDDAYHRRVAVLTMVGAVARAYRPGCKFDFMPILEGAQGKRKSTWIRILAKGWGSETAPDFGDPKALVESITGKWITEIAELDKFDRASENGLKAAISRTVDRARLSYGRRAQDFPRQCIFIGTTNEDDYLKDRTGGRRYWPVVVRAETIDTDRLAEEVDILWGEAVEIYVRLLGMRAFADKFGDLPLYVKGEAANQAAELQESRRAETALDVLKGELAAVIEEPEAIDLDGVETVRTVTCVLQAWELLGRERARLGSAEARMMGQALRSLGWLPANVRRFNKYGAQKAFQKPDRGRHDGL